MNKLLIALLAGGVIFGGVFALAASLDVFSAGLATGSQTIEGCDNSVEVTYTTSFQTDGYYIDTVTVGDISGACDGEDISVTLVDGESSYTYEGTGISSPSATLTVTDSVSAETVSDVYVLIGGVVIPTP